MRELSQHIQEKITEVFGLESFRAFSCRDDDTGQITHDLDYMWAIVLNGSRFTTYPVIVVGLSKTSRKELTSSYETSLLIEAHHEESRKVFIIDDLKPLQLPEPDPVAQVLQNLTILPISRSSIIGGVATSFDCYTRTRIGETYYQFYGDAIKYPSVQNLLVGTGKFLKQIKETYHDPRVNQIWEETDRNRRGGW